MSKLASGPDRPPGRLSYRLRFILGALALAALLAAFLAIPAKAPATQAGEKRKPAFELDGGTAWLNTAAPLSLKDLRGRVVLLDFWTLCCINCIHTLPDLARLEAKYPGVLVVIGVHTPKFPNEKNTSSIRKAILRYEIAHPVVNDADTAIWRRYGVRSWPTLVLIDPEGNFYGGVAGEGAYNVLDEHIGKLVKEYRARKMLNEKPLAFQLEKDKVANNPLCFPGKILADEKGDRLFIADSTHHRIVITTLAGKKIAVAGSGEDGFKSGTFAEATFSDPQGMALDGDTLYVADRKNHAIRALNLKEQTVKTVAGTGKQDRLSRQKGGVALKTGLNSPWDLHLHGKTLFIAMAGHHQIWTMDLTRGRVDPYAGNGNEDIRDGDLLASEFAQPSGLSSDGKQLYVADSETSAIRAMPITGRGKVRTLVGEGLFEFGDIDGVGKKVRLQHALAAVYKDGKLWVADTYNSKLKTLDLKTNEVKTFAGKGGGWLGGPAFDEPGGLSFAGDKLYVADTNAHRIRVVDVNTRELTTLELSGVAAPKRGAEAPKRGK